MHLTKNRQVISPAVRSFKILSFRMHGNKMNTLANKLHKLCNPIIERYFPPKINYEKTLTGFTSGLQCFNKFGFVGPDVKTETSKTTGDYLVMQYSSIEAGREIYIAYFKKKAGIFNNCKHLFSVQ